MSSSLSTSSSSLGVSKSKPLDHMSHTHVTTAATTTSLSQQVLQDLRQYLQQKDMNGSINVNIDDNNNNEQTQHTELSSSSSSSLFDTTVMAIPVAAMKTLLNVVQRSTSETMMGLQEELQLASQIMIQQYSNSSSTSTSNSSTETSPSNDIIITTTTPVADSIGIQSGIELFLRYITRTYLEIPNFDYVKQLVLQRGQYLQQQLSSTARDRITSIAIDFITPNCTILTIGFSRIVANILQTAASSQQYNKQFHLIICEGRPNASGARAAQCYANDTNISVTVITDAAMAHVMETHNVTMVLVGANAIVENGGIFNQIGTYTCALCAHVYNIPFYVAAESYKFARLYPLHQSDVPNNNNNSNGELKFVDTTTNTNSSTTSTKHKTQYTTSDGSTVFDFTNNNNAGSSNNDSTDHNCHNIVNVINPTVDYTPPKYITLLFTDLGVLTTSAVSDELIQLYQ